jgi:hypothetical protein
MTSFGAGMCFNFCLTKKQILILCIFLSSFSVGMSANVNDPWMNEEREGIVHYLYLQHPVRDHVLTVRLILVAVSLRDQSEQGMVPPTLTATGGAQAQAQAGVLLA